MKTKRKESTNVSLSGCPHTPGFGSLVRGTNVDQRGEQQEFWRLLQQDQIVTPEAIVVDPAAVDLKGCRIVMLLLVEERSAL